MKRETIFPDLMRRLHLRRVAEVGVLRGAFSAKLRNAGPDHLYLVDPWLSYDGFDDYAYTQADWDKLYQQVMTRFAGPACTVIRATSAEAAQRFTFGSLDLVYIDANHSYASVKEDIALWRPKVRPGGVLGGHDYNLDGVSQAVHEQFTDVRHTGEKVIRSWYVYL